MQLQSICQVLREKKACEQILKADKATGESVVTPTPNKSPREKEGGCKPTSDQVGCEKSKDPLILLIKKKTLRFVEARIESFPRRRYRLSSVASSQQPK